MQSVKRTYDRGRSFASFASQHGEIAEISSSGSQESAGGQIPVTCPEEEIVDASFFPKFSRVL